METATDDAPELTLESLSLGELYLALNDAIGDEKAANRRRVQLEEVIARHPEVVAVLKPEGTTNIGDLFKITTGYTRKWDQDALNDLAAKIKPEYWPFKAEHKEVRAESKMIEKKFPELWGTIASALTLTPSKISVKPVE